MTEHNTTILNTQLSAPQVDRADRRRSTETLAKREDAIGTPVQELCVAMRDRPGNRYGPTNVSNNASAVLGDVTHNYFYGGQVPYLADLQAHQERYFLEPDAISDYDANYARWLRSEQRLEHTCEWVFERTAYKHWVDSTGPPILIVSGSVGSGKSITASAVIDKMTVQRDDTRPIISYFVDHSRERPTTCVEIMRALVKQILYLQKATNEDTYKDFQTSLLSIFPSSQARPSTKTITHLLAGGILRTNPCIFVIDGIDALLEKEIDEFLDFLLELFPSTNSDGFPNKLVLFCRQSLGRGIRLESIPSSVHCKIRPDHIQRDLFAFVDHGVDLKQRRRPITDDPHLIEETKQALKTHCGKMFLWIRLQISSLWDPGLITCDNDIRQQLSSLPEGLDEIYIRCLRRIEYNYSKRSHDIAPKLFKWVSCAIEPLTQMQAREAVGMTAQDVPISKSDVLNTPAEDHCANLVILDEISGRVTFPHPSVKKFLRDPLKVPPELHRYLLSDNTDDLWCGEICLAYAHHLHFRKQLVSYKTTRVQEDITDTLIRGVPGAWLTSLFRKPRSSETFSLPLPSPAAKSHQLSESGLHDYMRRHWLSHNRQIDRDRPRYPEFEMLCLGQDPQLQPWSISRAIGFEHYQKLFEFAVMTNHAPLLKVAINHLANGKRGLLSQILSRSCPGTDTTWLHICAALGHQEVIQVLLPYCSLKTAHHGKSAAVLALEHGNHDLFRLLIPHVLDVPVWHLNSHEGILTPRENLLRACAMYGNSTANHVLHGRLRQRLSREYLSDALLHAWKYNSPEVADQIFSMGASQKDLHLIVEDEEYYRSHFSLNRLCYSTFFIALHLGQFQAWRTFWSVKIAHAVLYRDPLKPLLSLFGADGLTGYLRGGVDTTLKDNRVFEALELLSRSPAIRGGLLVLGASPTWLDIIIEHIRDASSWNHFIAWNSILRELLAAMYASWTLRQALTPQWLQFGGNHFTSEWRLSWFDQILDDVLVGLFTNKLVGARYTLDPTVIESLGRRWSSRGLEAWLESLGLGQTLCLSTALEEAARRQVQLEPYQRGVSYRTLLQAMRRQAIEEGRPQVKDFLSCYEFSREDGATFGREGQSLQDMLSAWDTAGQQAVSLSQPRESQSRVFLDGDAIPPLSKDDKIGFPSTLTWLRLYSMNGASKADGDTSQKVRKGELLRGIDGNFALNYPAGYDLQHRSHGLCKFASPAARTHIGLPVRRCIITAVYRWNHRLQRKRAQL